LRNIENQKFNQYTKLIQNVNLNIIKLKSVYLLMFNLRVAYDKSAITSGIAQHDQTSTFNNVVRCFSTYVQIVLVTLKITVSTFTTRWFACRIKWQITVAGSEVVKWRQREMGRDTRCSRLESRNVKIECALSKGRRDSCLIVGSLPRKVSPGRQFTDKNSPRPAVARAGRIFTGKFSAGGDFSGTIL